MINILLIFLVSALCVSEALASGCPDLQAVKTFNLTDVSGGIWYEISRYEYDVETATSCIVIHTRPLGFGFVGESVNVPSTSPEYLRGECTVADDSGRGVLNFTLSSGGEPRRIRLLPEVKVIYNEDGYIISYSCLEDGTKNSHEEFAWIFSRKQVLSDEEKEDLILRVGSLDALDINKFVWIDQSQCNDA